MGSGRHSVQCDLQTTPCRGVFSAFIWRVWDPSVQLRELRTLFGASAPLNWAHSSVRGLSAIIRRLHSSALRKQNEKMNSRSLHDLSWVSRIRINVVWTLSGV